MAFGICQDTIIVAEDLQCLPKYLEEIRGKSQHKGAPGVDLTAVFDSWRTTRERGEKPKEIQRTCKGNEIRLCSHGHQHLTKLKRHRTNCNRIQVPRTLAFIFLQLPHLHCYIIRKNKYRFSTYRFQSAINATNRLFQFWLHSTVTIAAAFSSVGSTPYFHQSSLTTAFSTFVFNSITSTAATILSDLAFWLVTLSLRDVPLYKQGEKVLRVHPGIFRQVPQEPLNVIIRHTDRWLKD